MPDIVLPVTEHVKLIQRKEDRVIPRNKHNGPRKESLDRSCWKGVNRGAGILAVETNGGVSCRSTSYPRIASTRARRKSSWHRRSALFSPSSTPWIGEQTARQLPHRPPVERSQLSSPAPGKPTSSPPGTRDWHRTSKFVSRILP